MVAAAVLVLVGSGCTTSSDSSDGSGADDGNGATTSTVAPVAIEVPDTPAGQALDWVLATIGSTPDEEALVERFSTALLDELPATQFQQMFEALPGEPAPAVVGMRSDTEHRVVAETILGGEEWLIEVVVAGEYPHLVEALFLTPANHDDGNVELPIPDTLAGDALGWFFGAIGTEPSDAELDEWLAPSLLEQLSHDQFRAQLATTAPDPPPSVRSIHTDEETMLAARVRLGGFDHLLALVVEPDSPHRITELLAPRAQPAPSMPSNLDEVVPTWSDLAPEAPLLVADVANGQCQPIVSADLDQPAPVASAFKLYVLIAVAEAVADGALSWDDPVPIREEWKSHPTGTFQELAAGTERTVREHAIAMIQASDNTATDHLIHLVGREGVEQAVVRSGHGEPELNQPLLTTREAFLIMMGGVDDDEVAVYRDADIDDRRPLLEAWEERPLPPVTDFPMVATRTDTAGWFASPQDLCGALVMLEELSRWPGLEPLPEILAAPEHLVEVPDGGWAWYKGGSAPGVLNGTMLVSDGELLVASTGTLVHPQLVLVDHAATMRVLGTAATLALE